MVATEDNEGVVIDTEILDCLHEISHAIINAAH